MRLESAALIFFLLALPFIATTAENDGYGYAVVHPECAPWDGPAIGITLTKERASCKQATYPNLRIYIWRGFPLHAPVTIHFDEKTDSGGASLCTDQNSCQRAVSGSVSFDSVVEGKSASGSYEFTFRDGSVVQGKFSASWCDDRIMCG